MSDVNDLIARAEKALEGTTPGPWRVHDASSMGYRCETYYQEIWNDDTDILVTTEVTRAHTDGGTKNMRFIAASRQLVPDLVAALKAERARAERAEMERGEAQAMQFCACSYDTPTDVCLGHHRLFERLYAAQRGRLEDRAEAAEAKLAKAVEALIWCSGSSDFNEGGIAEKGWRKICAPLIAELTGGKDDRQG